MADMTKPIDDELRASAVRLAYKFVPLPSGCGNCWGDLGEGCSQECQDSSEAHSKKIDEAVKAIMQLIKSDRQKLLDWVEAEVIVEATRGELKEYPVMKGSIDPSPTGTLPTRIYKPAYINRDELRTELRTKLAQKRKELS